MRPAQFSCVAGLLSFPALEIEKYKTTAQFGVMPAAQDGDVAQTVFVGLQCSQDCIQRPHVLTADQISRALQLPNEEIEFSLLRMLADVLH